MLDLRVPPGFYLPIAAQHGAAKWMAAPAPLTRNDWMLWVPLCLRSNQWTFSFTIQLEQERREAEMRAKREEEERKRQEELRRQQEEILRRQQEEERKRREEEELARRKQVCLWELCTQKRSFWWCAPFRMGRESYNNLGLENSLTFRKNLFSLSVHQRANLQAFNFG